MFWGEETPDAETRRHGASQASGTGKNGGWVTNGMLRAGVRTGERSDTLR